MMIQTRPTSLPPGPALAFDQAQGLVKQGAQLLDTRSPDEFAAGHWSGSLNVGYGGHFGQWAGKLLDPSQPVVLVADPGHEQEAISALGGAGFDKVSGYLEGGIDGLFGHADQVTVTRRILAADLAKQLGNPNPPNVLDVRGTDEYSGGHIHGSRNIPLVELQKRIAEVPTDRPLVVNCGSGYRSSMAVSLLQRQGLTCTLDLMGGIAAWKEAGLPLET